MSHTQKYSDSEILQSLDEAEDLTLYADEKFDTDEVDLFEFSSEDDSPLTNLKSIVLSLDWEINVEILEEMLEEIRKLQDLWQGNKVLNIYLQGLTKIGTYVKNELANAHPNSIKMLLIFYSNLEKIVSSDGLEEDEIKKIVSDDIRKFRIMRYQISRRRISSLSQNTTDEGDASPEIVEKKKELRRLQAIILGIDWEISDKTLQSLTREIDSLSYRYKNDSCISALLQGLRSLGRYIALEKAHTHPDAFPLLHSFYEGIESTVLDETLSEEDKKTILIEKIENLNALRATIADDNPGEKEKFNTDELKTSEVVERVETIEKRESLPVTENIESSEKEDEAIEDIAFLSDPETPEVTKKDGIGQRLKEAAPIAALTGFTENQFGSKNDDDVALNITDEIDSHISDFFTDELMESDESFSAASNDEAGEAESESTLKDVLFIDDSKENDDVEEVDTHPDVVASLSDEPDLQKNGEELLSSNEVAADPIDSTDNGPLEKQLDQFFTEDDTFLDPAEDDILSADSLGDEPEDEKILPSDEDSPDISNSKMLNSGKVDEFGDELSEIDLADEDVDDGSDIIANEKLTAFTGDINDVVSEPAITTDNALSDNLETDSSDNLVTGDGHLQEFNESSIDDGASLDDFSDEDLDNRLDTFFNDEMVADDLSEEAGLLSAQDEESSLDNELHVPEFDDSYAASEETDFEEVAGFFDVDEEEEPTDSDDNDNSLGLGLGVAAGATVALAGGMKLQDEDSNEELIHDVDPANIVMLDDDDLEMDGLFGSDRADTSSNALFLGRTEEIGSADETFESKEDILGEKATSSLDEVEDTGVLIDEKVGTPLDSISKDTVAEQDFKDLGSLIENLSEESSSSTLDKCSDLIRNIQKNGYVDEGQKTVLQLLQSSLDSVGDQIGDPEKTIHLSETLGKGFISSTKFGVENSIEKQNILLNAMGSYIFWQQDLLKDILNKK